MFYCYTNKSAHTHASIFVIQVKMTMIRVTSLLPYLIIYLLTMSLIGSAPRNTCYKPVSRSTAWSRMNRVHAA